MTVPKPTDPRRMFLSPAEALPTPPRGVGPGAAAPVEAPKRTRTHGISAALLAYLQANEGRVINLTELEDRYPDFAPASMRAALRGLVIRVEESGTGKLTAVIAGQSWHYSRAGQAASAPEKPATDELPLPSVFERMGTQTDGALVLRDENGILWKAVML